VHDVGDVQQQRRPSAPAGCERAKVVGGEAARFQQRDRERIAERERRGGAGSRREVRAGRLRPAR
jgi:hypothetical protein